MIEVEKLSKSYGDFPALQPSSFVIGKERGVTALLGPNGAGKTTTLRLLTGYLTSTTGRIQINGMELNTANRMEIKKEIGYLPETTPLYPEMLVDEYLRFMGHVRGLSSQKTEASLQEMVEILELGSHLYTPLGLLSKGFRQRSALAATLIHKPKYIILDEPTSGLDPNQIQHIRQLIKTLGKEQTLILSTHILQEVEDICDRVIILNRGRVVADDASSALRSAQACRVVLKAKDPNKTQETLTSIGIVKDCRVASAKFAQGVDEGLPQGYMSYICELKEDKPERLFAEISSQKDWEVREISPVSRSLQEVFHQMTA